MLQIEQGVPYTIGWGPFSKELLRWDVYSDAYNAEHQDRMFWDKVTNPPTPIPTWRERMEAQVQWLNWQEAYKPVGGNWNANIWACLTEAQQKEIEQHRKATVPLG